MNRMARRYPPGLQVVTVDFPVHGLVHYRPVGSAVSPDRHSSVVRKGWLQKRIVHIKTWSSLYFVLRDDGSLAGYLQQPDVKLKRDKWNSFSVRGCEIMTVDQPKPFTFIIRSPFDAMDGMTVIERTFCVETESERQQWIDAIRNVASRLSEMGEIARSPST